MAPKNIVAPDIAIDCLVVKPQQIATRGTVIPPPPIPPTFAIPISAESTKTPMNSIANIGNIDL